MSLSQDGLSYWRPDDGAARVAREMTVPDLLEEAVAAHREREALVAPGVDGELVRLTYGELGDEVVRIAKALLALGLEPGSRVMVWAPNLVHHPLLQHGCAWAGVIFVPINPLYRYDDIAYAVERARPQAIFLTPSDRSADLWGILDRLPPGAVAHRVALGDAPSDAGIGWDEWLRGGDAVGDEEVDRRRALVAPGDVSQIQFTSGTTGSPKGVQLTNRVIANMGRMMAERSEMTSDDRAVNPLPLFHCGGCIVTGLAIMAAGGTHVPIAAFDPPVVCRAIEDERGTFLAAVPTMLIALDEQATRDGQRLDSLRTVISGGAVVPPAVARRWRDHYGARFATTYGQTEFGPLATVTSPSDPFERQVTTVGRPLSDVELDVVVPGTATRVPVGETGELRYRGFVMPGYLDDPEGTAAAVTEDGWLLSGDLGEIDAEGYVRISGRKKEMVIRGGENISPAAVEDDLRDLLDAVADACVIGVPDDVYGEELCAFVRCHEGATLDVGTMRATLAERVARFRIPRYLVLVDAFPQTPTGKIQRFLLREAYDRAVEDGSLQDSRRAAA